MSIIKRTNDLIIETIKIGNLRRLKTKVNRYLTFDDETIPLFLGE